MNLNLNLKPNLNKYINNGEANLENIARNLKAEK